MRSIWKGAISFGLVSIPVKLYSATEERDVSFHQVHRDDAGRIRYKRVCQIDGEEVSYSDIAKGFELPSGEVVVLTDEDFAALPLTTSRSIDVLEFVPLEQVDPIYFAKSYYLEPEGAGAKPYVLLREALERSGRVALVKIALRQRETLATLRVRDGVFVLEMMLWPDEIREASFGFLDDDIEVRQQELAMAQSLIDTLSGDFHPEQYSDNYREALQALIDAKIEGREVVAPVEPTGDSGTVVDLMAALRASVEAAKEGRGETAVPIAARKPPPAKMAPAAKKSAAKKTAAKKATAGRETTRKTAVKKQAGKRASPAAAKKSTAKRVNARKSA
jgi:DNA end-binding protein Ku